ncbi:MAG TPA: triose-phosphate isomerase, partial [Bradyrhizobium sp.]|nr:triose-phosphate isomerase [Bradyrhizobium sp.]
MVPAMAPMRRKLIAGNWKMFKTVAETVAYLHALRGLLSSTRKSDVVVAPPFTAIQAASTAARDSDIGIAGQN